MEGNPAIVFTKPGEVVLEEAVKPEPGDGQVLIRTRRSLISTGTELTILSGEFPADSAWSALGKFPFRAGYSNAGDIVAVGPGVDYGLVGNRVASYMAHALYNVTDVGAVHEIPHAEVTYEDATFFTLGVTVMNGVRRARIDWGESVVIYGAGILGQLAARFCRLCGARPVVVADLSQSRLQLLPDDAAIVPVNPSSGDVVETVRKATHGRMADVVFEVTGNQDLIPKEFACLRRQGRFILLSSPRGATQFDFHDLCNGPSFTIIGTHILSHPKHGELDLPWSMRRNGELLLDLVAGGELVLDPLVTRRGNYTEGPDLYRMLLEDRSQSMGIILEWPE